MLFPLESRDGSETDVFPTRIRYDPERALYENIEWPMTIEGYLDSKLRLHGESFQLVKGFVEEYLDRELLPQYRDIETDGASFDDYGDNVFRYADLRCMLEEIRHIARAISLGEETDAIRQRIPFHILACHGEHKKENNVLLDELRNEIADYMLRFCDAVQSVMDHAPEYDLLDFQGP